MQRILSTHLWRTVKAQAKKSRCRKAAVAYVTKDLIGFRKGDTLVTDASESVISSGGTNAKLLATLHRRGVALYSCPDLHAKVLLLDDVAVIGSGNMSVSSRSTLVEAAVMTDSSHAVSGVDSFIHQLIEQSSRLDLSAINSLCKIKVVRRGGRGGVGKPRKTLKISPLGNQTWLVGVYELLKTTEAEDEWVERNKEAVAQKHGTDAEEVDWIKWAKKGRFVDNAKPGDQLIQIWRKKSRTKQPTCVLRAVPLLQKKRLNGYTYAFIGERKGPKAEIPWRAFKKIMKQLGEKPGSIYSEYILSPDLAEAINRSWKTIR